MPKSHLMLGFSMISIEVYSVYVIDCFYVCFTCYLSYYGIKLCSVFESLVENNLLDNHTSNYRVFYSAVNLFVVAYICQCHRVINAHRDPTNLHILFFFFTETGTAPVVPFMPPLVLQLGYSPVVLGTIYMILPLVGLLAKPIFGFLADR